MDSPCIYKVTTEESQQDITVSFNSSHDIQVEIWRYNEDSQKESGIQSFPNEGEYSSTLAKGKENLYILVNGETGKETIFYLNDDSELNANSSIVAIISVVSCCFTVCFGFAMSCVGAGIICLLGWRYDGKTLKFVYDEGDGSILDT